MGPQSWRGESPVQPWLWIQGWELPGNSSWGACTEMRRGKGLRELGQSSPGSSEFVLGKSAPPSCPAAVNPHFHLHWISLWLPSQRLLLCPQEKLWEGEFLSWKERNAQTPSAAAGKGWLDPWDQIRAGLIPAPACPGHSGSIPWAGAGAA